MMPGAIRQTVVTFWIANELCALDVLDVLEVTPALEVTPVPGATRNVRGVVSWRGVTIPVVDLRTPSTASANRAAPVVLLRRPERFGVLIDRPGNIQRIDLSDPPPLKRLDSRELVAMNFGRTE